jgi:metal-sulfur cluster biosynthetic enzyme
VSEWVRLWVAQEITMPVTQEEVLTALKDCHDPEIPVNIVDLGLIYNVALTPAVDPTVQDVTIDLTLTSPGCPSHVQISADVTKRLLQIPGIANASVNIVWEPQWTPERLSPAAKEQLGIEV